MKIKDRSAPSVRLIGWLIPTSDKRGTEIIRHADLSARYHRPRYPATLDPKNTKAFPIVSFAKKDFDPKRFWGFPVYFTIKKIGGRRCAVDVEIIPSREYQRLGIGRIKL